ncbi:MAG: glycosyltransferase [Firmicutes bacterium]|nr:glycosyltransferase [Bacillota bacterium]
MLASVVIPVYNRRLVLREALLHLARQSLPARDFEVVVVDDGSTDGTPEMVERVRDETPYRLKLLRQGRVGQARARNLGISASDGGLMVFIDSDLLVCRDFLKAHVEAHFPGGRPSAGEGLVGRGPVIHTTHLGVPRGARMKLSDMSRAFFATGNASVRKEHLLRAGLFDEDFKEYGWEDFELGIRLKGLGLRMVRLPRARGYHFREPLSLAQLPSLKLKEWERGRGAVLLFSKHPTKHVKSVAMLHPAAFLLDRALAACNWPETRLGAGVLRSAERYVPQVLFRSLVRVVTFHAYMGGVREALRWRSQESGLYPLPPQQS